MNAFEDVTLEWKGLKLTIPSNRVMGAICRIEDHVTMTELRDHTLRGSLPMAKIASAYASILRYAGATQVQDEDVYQAMFGKNAEAIALDAVTNLLSLMVPRDGDVKLDKSEGNVPAAARNSSGKRTKQRSAAASG